MDRDPVVAAAVQKGIEAHLRRQRRWKADLLDMALPLPVYEAVRNQDLDLLAAFIAHPLFERYDFQPHLMDLALPGRKRDVIELIRAQVEPYASFDRELFDAILDRDAETIRHFERELFAEDYSLALEIEKTYRQAFGILPADPNQSLDTDVSRLLPNFRLHTAVQAHEQPHSFTDQTGNPDPEELQFLLKHLAQRYGLITFRMLKGMLLQTLPASLNSIRPSYSGPFAIREAAYLHPQNRLHLEICTILIGYMGDLQPFSELLPECVAHDVETWGNHQADALEGLNPLGVNILLDFGANPLGLTKLNGARYGARKITALDVCHFYQGQLSDSIRSAGGKRAHDLRREAQPDIEAMLADLNLT